MNQDWQRILLSPDTSIEAAIKTIDKGALRLALVVDEQQKLLGTVTDGDVRRGIIGNISLSEPVQKIMNVTPRVADLSFSKAQLIALMENCGLLSVPVVHEGRLVGLETLQHLLHKEQHDNPVFLMAGGFGTRLQPLTNNCPKPLLKVGDKPILEIILESFISAGFHQFYISTHYMPELIREHFGDGSKWGVTIKYVHEDEPLGTAGALGLLPDDLPNLPLLMMNGDILTKVDFAKLLNYHKEHNARATMCVREYEYQVPYGVVMYDDFKVTSMVEKPTHKHFVNAGIYVIDSELVATLDKPARLDMPDLLSEQIDQGQTVAMYPVHEYWLDIGRLNDFKRAQDDFIEGF